MRSVCLYSLSDVTDPEQEIEATISRLSLNRNISFNDVRLNDREVPFEIRKVTDQFPCHYVRGTVRDLIDFAKVIYSVESVESTFEAYQRLGIDVKSKIVIFCEYLNEFPPFDSLSEPAHLKYRDQCKAVGYVGTTCGYSVFERFDSDLVTYQMFRNKRDVYRDYRDNSVAIVDEVYHDSFKDCDSYKQFRQLDPDEDFDLYFENYNKRNLSDPWYRKDIIITRALKLRGANLQSSNTCNPLKFFR